MTLQVWHNNPPEQNESEWYVKIEAEGKLDADGSKVTSVHGLAFSPNKKRFNDNLRKKHNRISGPFRDMLCQLTWNENSRFAVLGLRWTPSVGQESG